MTILENLEKYVVTELAVNLGKQSLVPDEDLLEQGILDSLGVMNLILFMEKTFSIAIADKEIVPENFQTLNIMAKFVEQKMRNT